MNQKSYDGKPTLYIVPTPIGNMEDIILKWISSKLLLITSVYLSNISLVKRMELFR